MPKLRKSLNLQTVARAEREAWVHVDPLAHAGLPAHAEPSAAASRLQKPGLVRARHSRIVFRNAAEFIHRFGLALYPGSDGSERVRWVQSSLNRILGLKLPINGVLGVETRSAIRSFQKKKGLPVDGLIGPPTERALTEATAGPIPDSGGAQRSTSAPPPPAAAPPPADAGTAEPSAAAEPSGASGAEPPSEELLELFSGYEFPQGEFAPQPEYEDFQARSNFRHRAICRRCGCGQSTEPEYGSSELIPEFEEEDAFGESEFSFSQIPQSILSLFRPTQSGVSAAPAPATYGPTPPAVPSAAPTSTGGLDVVNVRGITVARQIASQVDGLLAAAQAAGVRLSGGGFRSPEKQIALRRQNCGPTDYDIYQKKSSLCKPPTAIPGQSNHERGLAIDFTYNGGGIEDHNNPGYKWLAANAGRFGLYNLPSEPWHWSINGK